MLIDAAGLLVKAAGQTVESGIGELFRWAFATPLPSDDVLQDALRPRAITMSTEDLAGADYA